MGYTYIKHLISINIISYKIDKNKNGKLKSKTLDWETEDLISALFF